MSRFKRIKNTSTKKSSVSIDEKIAALNQELEKTGMSNVSEMTTDDVYVTGTEEPNPAYEDFIAASFGGKGFAMSGFGGASIGGATFDTNGLAFGPDGSGPATSYLGLSSGFGPAVPGSQRTPEHRKIGAFLWYWNGSGYSTLEWKFNNQNVDNTGGWASWQDTAFGFPHLVFISAIPGFNPALAAAVASAGGGGAFPDPDDVTPPTNPVFTKDRLGEPSFLPIDIAKRKAGGDMGTSSEAFDSFSEKSKGDKGEGDKGEDDKGEEDDQEEFDAEKEKLYQENIRKLAQLLRMSEKEFMRKAEALGYMTYLRNILYAKDPAALKIAHKFMVSQYHGLSKIIGQITGLKTAANMLVTYDRYIGSGSTAPLDVTNQVDRGSMVKLMRAVQKAKQSSKYKSYQKSLAKIDSGESKANRNDVLDLMRDAVRESLQKTTKPDVSIGGFNIGKFLNPNLQQTFHNNVQVDKKVFDKSGGKKIVLTKTYKFNPGSSVATAEKTWWGKLLTAGGVELDRMGVGAYAVPALIASYLTLKNVGVKHGGKAYNARGMPMRVKIPDVRVETYELESQMLTEDVALGHFEPQELYIDIEKLKKGIMPEFPKKAPPEMIDGYSATSKLAPRVVKGEPTIKITRKDLAKFHKLKKSEIDEFMNTVKRINNYLQKHPEELIYAQQRYPKDDPRLAALNWKMDQMNEAGKRYIDQNFKVNQTLYKRATERTQKNIKLTDPKYVQQKYDELRGTIKPKRSINKRNVSRFFKKPVNKKSSMEEIDDKIKQLDKDLLL